MPKAFSVLIGCYGDYPQYSVRAVQSVITSGGVSELCDVHVGASACCAETLDKLRALRSMGLIDSLVESGRNINKDPIMRLLIDLTRTRYLVWMDDDSHLSGGALHAIASFIAAHPGMDVGGHVFYRHRDPDYQSLAEKRPWWPGMDAVPAEARARVFFPTGGLFIARASFLRRHDYPDRRMVKRFDDVLLGDLVALTGGQLDDFGHDPLMGLVRISDGERRGEGEAADAVVALHDGHDD